MPVHETSPFERRSGGFPTATRILPRLCMVVSFRDGAQSDLSAIFRSRAYFWDDFGSDYLKSVHEPVRSAHVTIYAVPYMVGNSLRWLRYFRPCNTQNVFVT
jgi:hypothetical protein